MDLSLIHLALTDMIWTFLTTHSNQGDVKMLFVKYCYLSEDIKLILSILITKSEF